MKKVITVLAASLLVIIALVIFSGIYVVETGSVAVVSTFGKISSIENEGLHFKIPFVQSKYEMETREKAYIFSKTAEMDTTMEVSTKDMQTILVEFIVQAQIIEPEVLYRAFNRKYEERFIRPRVKEIVQATIAKYTIEEFISKRATISSEIFEDLTDDFVKYGLSVSNVSIINHDFSDEYEAAVESKKIAEQAVERAKAEQTKLLVEQENKVKVAEFTLKEKELQAKANEVESNSLSPALLQKLAIEKWDGKLPMVQGEAGNTFIDFNALKTEE